ncbi:TrbG/VirB9 family P-type conjugative transfer protein [Phenylobacterium sp.]|uniref:TrbG/VirB9 family P-type conjugative transfer protein n=1 Tax=Phenylobacterium sp. TaxID=1871053 RepID=UPI002DE8D4C7|nr:TrbG/VirB9 family P-type conjugative transfer protein [Phenylobacterium sp.]
MRSICTRLTAGFVLLVACPAGAVVPHARANDPRIGEVLYAPDQVVELTGVLGYQLSITFDPAERIENVAIGDGQGWQITPNRGANLLFVKPMGRRKATNMTVVTTLRRYDFRLATTTNSRRRSLFYSIRFDYPPPAIPVVTLANAAPVAPPEPQDVNHAYSYQGSARNLPERVFDDGKATYFRFTSDGDVPAILVMEANGSESVTNVAMRGGYMVADTIARGFVLRRGPDVTRLFNDGFQEPAPGPLSPKPRPKPTPWWRR